MVRVSLLLGGSFLVLWITVLGSTGTLQGWRAGHKALTPQAFNMFRAQAIHSLSKKLAIEHTFSSSHEYFVGSYSKSSTRGQTRGSMRPMSSLLRPVERAPPAALAPNVAYSVVEKDFSALAMPISRAHWLFASSEYADGIYGSAQYRKRALALRRASGRAARTLVAPEELTASEILPEEPNGVTLMIAISAVLVFATLATF
ncbi:hypothetical protein BX667DRAFT_498694 [Coemansia mojavensis]|nr:hypothetical protein BX667DRAFT_498694 [Coemansia mojavensis]